jgi:hypothetical protein
MQLQKLLNKKFRFYNHPPHRRLHPWIFHRRRHLQQLNNQ